MEISNTVINKSIIECLTNRNLYRLVKSNFTGFKRFADLHKDLVVFYGVIDYINSTEYDNFNSIDLVAKLRGMSVSEGTLTELLGNIDYLRSINSDKPILPKTVSLLKHIFYSGHYDAVKDKPIEEIFEYSRSIEWVTDVIDPRFKIEDISTGFDISEINSLLAPSSSIKSSLKFVNESSPNKGYFPNELVTISAAPGTGKTQFLYTEALNFIKQGKKVLYIALGDMVNYKITIRLMCMYCRISPEDAYLDLEANLKSFQSNETIRDNFKFVCVESGKFSPFEVFNFLSLVQDRYDVWMVDYDGNFASDSDNLYREGGHIYDYAINLCRNFNKLGFIASQPKQQFWECEALSKTCLAESSRKQQITDSIITFGLRQNVANKCGLAQIVKRRDGETVFGVPWAAAESGQITQIDNEMYGELIESRDRVRLVLNDGGTIDLPDNYFDSIDP